MSRLNHLLMVKVSDADAQSKMKSFPFLFETFQSIVTVGDMEEFYNETEGGHND